MQKKRFSMKRKASSIAALFLVFLIGFGSPAAGAVPSARQMSENVSNVLAKSVPAGGLQIGAFDGEWTVIALARAGRGAPAVYDTYSWNAAAEVQKKKGVLSDSKDTEYSRAILGLTAVGRNPRNVSGYNLIQPLANYDKVVSQGINGAIYALLALDSGKYSMPTLSSAQGTQNSRQKMVDYILSKEINKGTNSAGGWALTGTDPDPDITSMALQALANYTSSSSVHAAVDRAVSALSKIQSSSGGYTSWGTENSESTAQVIVALTALGISPERQDFVKNGHTLISVLAQYYLPGKGFKNMLSDSSANKMATDQCAYALAAYNRFQSGENSLYDMTDVHSVFDTFSSDTEGRFSVSGAYLFRISSKNGRAPVFSVGTPGIFTQRLVKKSGSSYFFRIQAVGPVGSCAGIYVNGSRIAVASIRSR